MSAGRVRMEKRGIAVRARGIEGIARSLSIHDESVKDTNNVMLKVGQQLKCSLGQAHITWTI